MGAFKISLGLLLKVKYQFPSDQEGGCAGLTSLITYGPDLSRCADIIWDLHNLPDQASRSYLCLTDEENENPEWEQQWQKQ